MIENPLLQRLRWVLITLLIVLPTLWLLANIFPAR
jgi:hypothetical protein